MVEDERTLARAIKRGLEADGLLTDLAHDGAAGLELARVGDYDVVVLDIMLPLRNGYDVCRDLREAGVWTPVLMLTAKDGEYDQVDAFDLRALIRRGGVERSHGPARRGPRAGPRDPRRQPRR